MEKKYSTKNRSRNEDGPKLTILRKHVSANNAKSVMHQTCDISTTFNPFELNQQKVQKPQ